MEKLLLRPIEVTVTLGISRARVYELIASKELPCVRIGRSVRVPAEALKLWIEDRQDGGIRCSDN